LEPLLLNWKLQPLDRNKGRKGRLEKRQGKRAGVEKGNWRRKIREKKAVRVPTIGRGRPALS